MHRTQGFILASEKTGETDQLISVFSRDFGKMKVVAQGSLKHDSKMRTIVQVGHAIDFSVLPLRSGRYRLTSPFIIDAYSAIRNDRYKLAVVLFSLGVLDRVLHEGEPDARLWNFLISWFSELWAIDISERAHGERLAQWFSIRCLEHLGGLDGNVSETISPAMADALHADAKTLGWTYVQQAYRESLGFSLPRYFLI